MIRRRQLIFVIILWLPIKVLAACLPSEPLLEDIIGVWIENQATCDVEDTVICGSFEFFSDGSFEAHDIPRDYFVLRGFPGPRFSASGSWKLDTSSKDPFFTDRVELIFDPFEESPTNFTSELRISVDGEVLFKGQEGNRIIFSKEDSN